MKRITVGSALCLVAAGLAATGHAERAAGLVNNNLLVLFDTASPEVVSLRAISNVGAGESLVGIDVRPVTGELYAVSVTNASAANSVVRMYRLNPDTGIATLVGETAAALAGAGDIDTGVDFNPASDRIRFVNTNDENARLNPNNGALAGDDTDLTPAVASDIIAVAHDRNTPPAGPTPPFPSTTLYVINRAASSLAIQGGIDGSPSPNGGTVTEIGPLGIALNPNRDAGFDITPEGVAYASLTSGGVTGLYVVNLSTGAAALIGQLPTELRSLAILPDVDPPAVQVRGLSSTRLRALLSRGFFFKFACDEACDVEAALTVRWRGRAVVIGRGDASFGAAAGARVRVAPTPAGHRIMRELLDEDQARTRAILEIVATDSAGNATTLRKRIVLRP